MDPLTWTPTNGGAGFPISTNRRHHYVAQIAERIATEEIDSEFLEPYNACRLIPLDKTPIVKPIIVGDVLRRIIGRSILRCIQNDLKLLGIPTTMSRSKMWNHAIHSLRNGRPKRILRKFEKPEVQDILLSDAKNAFNSLNRYLALRNIENMCPSIATALKNSYKSPTSLFVN